MNTERVDKQYYIDRKGNVVKYDGPLDEEIVSIHYMIAQSIYPDQRDPERILLRLGWVLVGSTVYCQPIAHKKPSQKQLDTLFDLGMIDRIGVLKDGFYEKLT